ncbi:MAG: murein biosynthesis integral membrane protein MurJ [Rhodobiaceae bacterium]|nr:murein biosynthesis integral membrane protein MurJ [Rhodobiaceae bacterium]MCC0012632.1 murein biosynthesis integral membrane protein MurJ [Rhodobiaceae bacterium]MCC0050773.1 murein biosynthesis integral membrane protein MurJ [Rhodobiaceae bacterium]MCC0061839.1 murein biosynthesis integral membrane protein MurJ [Rhodobiaceae bacterium]
MSLLRNFATVGSATAASRVLGFVRDMLMAAALGTGPVADAFFVAFRFPNLFRRLFAEGAFNSAFIPLFARKLEGESEDAARQFAIEALSGLLLALLVLTAVAEVAMPLLMFVLAPGFYKDPDKFDLAVMLTRVCFPYLTFVSMLALVSGVLNALGRFAVAAFAPVLLNVVLIATLTLVVALGYANTPAAGYWLSGGVFLGGVVQLAAVVYELYRSGWVLIPQRPRYTEGVRRLVRLSIPAVIAGGITQINIVIGTMIASMAAGAVSYLYYADRVYQLPLGIVGIAIGVVLLPDLSRRLRAGNEEAASGQQNRALEFAMVLTLPAAAALFTVSGPIIAGLFERGAFDAAATARTAPALAAFALGLPAFVMIKVFSPGFFAREDTRTPMWFAAINAIINVVLSLALFPFLQHIGIALATTVGGWVNATLLGLTLYRRKHFLPDERLRRRTTGAAAASGAMVMALIVSSVIFAVWAGETASLAGNILHLAVLTVVGLAAYAAAAVMLGVISRAELTGFVRRG